MERTGLTKTNFNRKVEQVARLEYNHAMRMNQFKPLHMCRKDARTKVDELHFIVDHKRYEGMREYDYKVERAVEAGRSTIYYKGRDISIM